MARFCCVTRIGLLVLRRACWALLVLVHVPALLRFGRSALDDPASTDLLASLALCLAVLVFALKLLDLAFLRFRSPRAGACAFLLAFALVHHEVATSEAGAAAIQQTPAALVTGALVEVLRRSLGGLRRLWQGLGAAALSGRGAPLVALVSLDSGPATPRSILARSEAPRAPPA